VTSLLRFAGLFAPVNLIRTCATARPFRLIRAASPLDGLTAIDAVRSVRTFTRAVPTRAAFSRRDREVADSSRLPVQVLPATPEQRTRSFTRPFLSTTSRCESEALSLLHATVTATVAWEPPFSV
jgi:hypothetical protein